MAAATWLNSRCVSECERETACPTRDNEQTVSDLLIYDGQGHNRNKSRTFKSVHFKNMDPTCRPFTGIAFKDSVQHWLAVVHDEECSNVLSRPNLSHLSDNIPQG